MDKLNRVTAVVDAISAQTQVAYDPNGRVLSLINALTHAIGYTYDANDRIATRTDPVVNYQYDTLDRLTQVNAVSGCRASLSGSPGDPERVALRCTLNPEPGFPVRAS